MKRIITLRLTAAEALCLQYHLSAEVEERIDDLAPSGETDQYGEIVDDEGIHTVAEIAERLKPLGVERRQMHAGEIITIRCLLNVVDKLREAGIEWADHDEDDAIRLYEQQYQ